VETAVAERTRRGTFGWRRLVLLSAAADAVVLLGYGAVRRDLEALGFGVVMLLGIGLLRVRGGLLGLLALGLLFVNVQLWMFPAANGNASNRVGIVDLLVPASLVAFSLAGLIGVGGALLRRRDPDAGGGAAATTGALAVVFVATSLSLVWLMTPSPNRNPPDGAVEVEARNVAFVPVSLTAGGDQVTVAIRNRDLFWHTLTIDALKVDLKVPVGRLRSASFEARPGTYDFYCRIPGHRTLGMRGTLTVR
jgi:plastocyanin